VLGAVVAFLLPVSLAYGATLHRYSQGWTGGGYGWVNTATSGYANRNYNGAYRGCTDGQCLCLEWGVWYKNSSGSITWYLSTTCSPTRIGNTIGPRKAGCEEHQKLWYFDYTYNCDTTIP
jgi:hypothetical protein